MNISSPKSSDIKKPINIKSVIDKAIPVILCNIESTEFNWGLYIVKWGDKGRFCICLDILY